MDAFQKGLAFEKEVKKCASLLTRFALFSTMTSRKSDILCLFCYLHFFSSSNFLQRDAISLAQHGPPPESRPQVNVPTDMHNHLCVPFPLGMEKDHVKRSKYSNNTLQISKLKGWFAVCKKYLYVA